MDIQINSVNLHFMMTRSFFDILRRSFGNEKLIEESIIRSIFHFAKFFTKHLMLLMSTGKAFQLNAL